jgi:hypothetical protein
METNTLENWDEINKWIVEKNIPVSESDVKNLSELRNDYSNKAFWDYGVFKVANKAFSIYEPHGISVSDNLNCYIIYGHETIILIDRDTYESEEIRTR